MRPGTNETAGTALPPTTPATKTGTWGIAGPTAQGPMTPYLCTSFAQFQKVFGARLTSIAYSATIWDSVEAFFLEGGDRLYFQRWQGSTAVTAAVKLKDSAAAETLEVKASGPGSAANNWKIVVSGPESAFIIQVQNAAGEALETSPAFASKAEAVAFFKTSPFIVVKEAGTSTKSPAAGSFSPTGGTDVGPSVTEAEAEKALAFPPECGPMQLSLPGVSSEVAIKGGYNAAANSKPKRVAVMDGPLLESKSGLVTLGSALQGLSTWTRRRGSLWADWQQLPPVQGTLAPRAVPLSPFVAAHCSVNDDTTGNPNQPPAGKWGILSHSIGREAVNWSEAELEELAEAGVNVTKVALGGGVRIYGFRTSAPRTTESLYYQFNNARVDMAMEWKADVILEEFFAADIDGQGKTAGDLKSELAKMCLGLYEKGALFGETPGQAFVVDTGADVNTLVTEEEGDLNATIGACRAKGAEQVNLVLDRVPITQGA